MWLNRLWMSSTGEPSLLKELWEYFEDRYFSVDEGQYEHIQVGSDALISLQKIVLGLFIGVIIAAAIACYDKNRLGAFVRKVIKSDCLWPEKAQTLSELGFARNGGVKASLRSPNKLGKVVRCVEKEAYEKSVEEARAAYIEQNGSDKDFRMPSYRINFDTDRFYIPYDDHFRVDLRYDQKGSGWRAFILVVILSIVGAALLCFLLPDMLQLVDNLLDILSDNDHVLH